MSEALAMQPAPWSAAFAQPQLPRAAMPSWLAPRPANNVGPLAFPAARPQDPAGPAPRLAPAAAPAAPAPVLAAPPASASIAPSPVRSVPPPRPSTQMPRVTPDVAPTLDVTGALRAEIEVLRGENGTLRAQLGAGAAALARLRTEVLTQSEPELVALAVAIAERVVGRELRADPGLVGAWAREALDALGQRDGAVVAVAPDLAQLVSEEALQTDASAPARIEVDPALPPWGCEVRAGASVVGASVSARVAAVVAALEEQAP